MIGENSENFFDEDFWESQDIIINAVDNIEARNYIDTQCTFFSKPYIDSGTLGTIASSVLFLKKLFHIVKFIMNQKKIFQCVH